MDKPVRASEGPIAFDVVAGKNYSWCSCGMTNDEPMCDGAHAGTDFQPVKYAAKETKTVYFCGCRQVKNGPLCDGSHKNP